MDHMTSEDDDVIMSDTEVDAPCDLLIWKFSLRAICNIIIDMLVFCLILYSAYHAVPALITALTELKILTQSVHVDDSAMLA